MTLSQMPAIYERGIPKNLEAAAKDILKWIYLFESNAAFLHESGKLTHDQWNELIEARETLYRFTKDVGVLNTSQLIQAR